MAAGPKGQQDWSDSFARFTKAVYLEVKPKVSAPQCYNPSLHTKAEYAQLQWVWKVKVDSGGLDTTIKDWYTMIIHSMNVCGVNAFWASTHHNYTGHLCFIFQVSMAKWEVCFSSCVIVWPLVLIAQLNLLHVTTFQDFTSQLGSTI